MYYQKTLSLKCPIWCLLWKITQVLKHKNSLQLQFFKGMISLKSVWHRRVLSLMGLPEESNDAYLLKKIEEATRRKKTFGIIGYLGFVACLIIGILLFGYGTYYMQHSENEFIKNLIRISLIIAVAGAFIFLYVRFKPIDYNNQIKDYYRKLTIIPEGQRACSVCPNCKKVLPKDYPDICIFCGYNPYRPNRKIMSPYKELKLIPVCPSCKKRLPEGNAPFCIYCGKPVKS